MEKTIYYTEAGLVIHPYKKGQSKSLENLTSMRDLGCKFKKIEVNGFRCGELFLTYHIPSFLLKNDFPDYDIKYVQNYVPRKIDTSLDIELTMDYELTDFQYQIVFKILRRCKKQNRFFINCPQGFGKTLITVYLISQFRLNTLIMCYSSNILKQWKEKILTYTKIPSSYILILDSSKTITKILNDVCNYSEVIYVISTPKLLMKYANDNGYDKLDLLFSKLNIGMKIYDEAHRDIGNIIKIDALSRIPRTLYLSGDFAQASKYKSKYFFNMFEGVDLIRLDADTLQSMRYTKAVVVEYNTHPDEMEILSTIGKRGFSVWDYMRYQLTDGMIIKVLYWLLDNILNLKEENRRILILTNMIEHCDEIYEKIIQRYPSYNIGEICGNRDLSENEYVKNNAHIIVATYSSFSTGMDTDNIKYVITTSVSNRVEDSQASGRARPLPNGEDCMYFMLVDIGFEIAIKKEQERLEYLKQVKIKDITKLNYEE